MSDYGITVKNNANAIQIDSHYENYVFGGAGWVDYAVGSDEVDGVNFGNGGEGYFKQNIAYFSTGAWPERFYEEPPLILVKTGFYNGDLDWTHHDTEGSGVDTSHVLLDDIPAGYTSFKHAGTNTSFKAGDKCVLAGGAGGPSGGSVANILSMEVDDGNMKFNVFIALGDGPHTSGTNIQIIRFGHSGATTSPVTSCANSCQKGTNMFVSFDGFSLSDDGKYQGFLYNVNRVGNAHGVAFEYCWFVSPNETPVEYTGVPGVYTGGLWPVTEGDFGLEVRNEADKRVFHSGHRYFTVVDQLKFHSSQYQQDWNGAEYFGYAYNNLSGAYFNFSSQDGYESPVSIQRNNGFHGYRTAAYDTISLPDGVSLSDVWFCVNGMSTAKTVETGWRPTDGQWHECHGEEWWSPMALWWESDGKVHISGMNGGNNYRSRYGGGWGIRKNVFLWDDNSNAPQMGDFYIPVCTLNK